LANGSGNLPFNLSFSGLTGESSRFQFFDPIPPKAAATGIPMASVTVFNSNAYFLMFIKL
jgi:hypothetical protein